MTESELTKRPTTTVEPELEVHIPDEATAARNQDEEWCEVHLDGEVRRIRFHDYAEVYTIPGLYEQIFYEKLECDSPRTVCSLLGRALRDGDVPSEDLSVLDVGAGNGMVGEELADMGAGEIVGIDILPEARDATLRDRPNVYEDYHVVDLTEDSDETSEALTSASFNCLTSVAALGFGDIPPLAFSRALDAVADDGLVVFNIRDRFLEESDRSGFSGLIADQLESGALETLVEHRYDHRIAVSGEPLSYLAFVARKRANG